MVLLPALQERNFTLFQDSAVFTYFSFLPGISLGQELCEKEGSLKLMSFSDRLQMQAFYATCAQLAMVYHCD